MLMMVKVMTVVMITAARGAGVRNRITSYFWEERSKGLKLVMSTGT